MIGLFVQHFAASANVINAILTAGRFQFWVNDDILYYKHRYVRGLDLMQCFVYKPCVENEGAEYLSKNNRNLAHTDAHNTVK